MRRKRGSLIAPHRSRRFTSLWYLDFVRQHILGERKTLSIMRVVQSVNYGAACGLVPAPPPQGDDDLVGHDVRLIFETVYHVQD